MNKKFIAILVSIFAICGMMTMTGTAEAEETPHVTLDMPTNVYRPVTFDVTSTATNPAGGTAYTSVRFKITLDGPVDFTGTRADTFTITKVNGSENTQGVNKTFELVDGDWVGYWGPADGFPMPASYNATSTFTVRMTDVTTVPEDNYELTVELVDLALDHDGTLATASASFNPSADTLYVGAGQQFTTIQTAIDAASSGDTINVAAGTYKEAILIEKPLSLIGAGAGETFIDLSGNPSGPTVVTIRNFNGNVTFSGFTVKTGPASLVASDGIYISGLTEGTITISDNVIECQRNAREVGTAKDNFGLIAGYITATTPKLVFTRNTVYGGGDNPILIENWAGSTEITDNHLYNFGKEEASDILFMMNHSGATNNQKQLISGNTFDMGWGATYNNDYRGSGISVVGSYDGGTTTSGFTNVEISNNTFVNLKPYRRGIVLWNDSDNGDGGNLANVVISGNTISGTTDSAGQFGIRILGKATGTAITNNAISGVEEAIRIDSWNSHYATGTVIHLNSLLGTTYGVNNLTSDVINAASNWWGDVSGPSGGDVDSNTSTMPASGTGGRVSSNILFYPWLDAPYPEGEPIYFTNSAGPIEINNDTFDDRTNTNTEIVVTGIATTTVAKYSNNPGSGFSGDIGKYIDVHIATTTGVIELEIRLYYTDAEISGKDESTLKMYWWDGTNWSPCSDTGVNTSLNYIWAKISSSTTPNLEFDRLSRTPFGAGGSPLATTGGGSIAGQFSPAAPTTGEVLGATTEAITVDELMAKVIELRAQLEDLQRRLLQSTGKVLGATYEGIPEDFTFKTNLKKGDSSIDVKYLQMILNSDPQTRLALSGVGSLGNETNYFGDLTKAAVIKFQEKYASEILAPWNLAAGTGLVGSTTRAKLNSLLK